MGTPEYPYMNFARIVISTFLLVLIVVAGTGWVWTGRHQPPPQAIASRLVLTVCIVAGFAALRVLWRHRATK